MEYLLKASAVLALFYICFYLILKRETFFHHNRWFLIIGIILALVFPLIVIPVEIAEPVVTPEINLSINKSVINVQNVQPVFEPFQWTSLIPILYGLGLLVFTTQFVFQVGSLIRLLIKNPKSKDGIFTYVIVNSKISPFSFFKWIVYNPKAFNKDELKLMLTHEKVHAKQLHSMDIILAQLACVIFWFNPLIWLYRKEIRQNLEYIADFKTQKKSSCKKEYQHLLLKTSIANHNITLSNNFYNSLIKERIVMLKKSRSDRKKQYKYLLILPLLAGLLMSMNTEKVYVEATTKIENNNPIEFVVPKNTTDALNLDNIKQSSVKIIFNKNMTDTQLQSVKKELKANEIDMNIKHLKRNDKSKISLINIDFKTSNGSANYNAEDKNGIKSFYFKMNENGSFGVGAVKDEEVVIETSKIDDQNNSSKSETFIYNSVKNKIYLIDSTKAELYNDQRDAIIERIKLKIENNDTIYYNSIDSSEVKRLSKLKSEIYIQRDKPVSVTSEHIEILQPNNKPHSFIASSSNQKSKPLIIVNGKSYNDNISKIEPNTIEKLEVIKGEKAITKYGKDGENGVVLIKTNQDNVVTSKSHSKENNPWQIERTEIESVLYIDEDDPNKNAYLLYLTKYSSDQILEKHKKNLESVGISVKYSKLKRNKSGEIISIKIALKTENGKLSSASWKDDDGIPSIEFGKTEESLIARTSDNKN